MTLAPVTPHGYRPALDGIRALAILLVVVDHVWHEPPVMLGATGVTLFFALSGYLITGLLVDELQREGRISFVRFYLRRAARLLPALLLVVVVCDLMFLAVGDLASVTASVYAVAYVANYATIWQGAYLPGWGQTWSLAVEEHFYLLWPLVVVVLLRRGRLRTLLVWTLVGCAAALAWRTGLTGLGDSDRVGMAVLHGTVARADALLLGCAAALLVRLGVRLPSWSLWPALTILVSVTVVALEVAWFDTVGQTLVSVAAATVVLCVDRPDSRAVPLLSWPPLVYVGVISYGLYLWHYPLIYLAHGLGVGEHLWARVLAGGLVAGLAAAASHRWVEAPVRAWARTREARVLELVSRPTV